MKKEYLILIGLILLLGGYLLFHNEDTDHTVLPETQAIYADKITSLEIMHNDKKTALVKKGKQWNIKEIERPAENLAVENMIDALKKFKLSALVSQKNDLLRYELDNDHKIEVTVFEKGKKVFRFAMGKTAPTYNHTFVMIENDKNVYHANGSFRSYFDKDAASLRDKKVMEFKEKAAKSITVTKDGITRTFTATEKKKDDKETEIFWSGENSTSVDKEAAGSLLSLLAFLECDKFMASQAMDRLKTAAPYCRIAVRTDQEIILSLFKEKPEEPLSGISSMNPDPFLLTAYNGDELLKNVDKLLGIEKKENETPEE